jgi:MFS family permease
MSSTPPTTTIRLRSWRTPAVLLICGCLISILGFGPRSSLGLFLTPISSTHGWGRDVFALALALQMLLWGAGQPFAGAVADRFGAVWVLAAGAVLYALGLVMMTYSTTPLTFQLTAGVLLGLGISASSFTIVIGAFGKLMPPQWRSLSFGFGTAAGSFGQFLFSPIAVGLIDRFGWIDSLLIFSGVVLLIIPFALALTTPPPDSSRGAAAQQPVGAALKEALRHKSYVLLVIGYFTCGFQLFFITVHLPAYLVDRGMSAEIGAWTIGVIGLCNIVGSVTSGWLGDRMPKRYLLAIIYFSRSIALFVFISLPPSPTVALAFGAAIGFLWLSTVPPTTGLVAVMFGTRWLTMLAGLAFFSHQVGGFLGVWLGGLVFERTGSYELIWWLSILFGVMSALINLPIQEKPVVRIAPQAA